jgi:hypothetical protein
MGTPRHDRRQKDVELVLRLLSMLEDMDSYEKPLKDFMSRYMKANRNLSAERRDALTLTFRTNCHRIVTSLGERPFHLRAGLNASMLDATFVAFARNPGRPPADIRGRYARLAADGEFGELIRSATTDTETVRQRMRLASERLWGQ